jgi:hypothetical protein
VIGGVALAWLTGCALRVQYGGPAALPLTRPSSDPTRWYTAVDTPAGPGVWFVDTGYSRTTCDDGLAQALSLRAAGPALVHGEAGTLWARRARLGALHLDDHVVTGVRCVVRDLASTSSIRDPAEGPVVGVLGLDVLRRFVVEVDAAHATVVLHAPGDRSAGTAGVALRPERRIGLRLEVRAEVAGRPRWLLVDTGADRSYLDGRPLGWTPDWTQPGWVAGSGPGGARPAVLRYYAGRGIRLGSADFPDLTLVDRSRGGHGLLGMDVWRQTHAILDFPRHRAVFEPTTAAPVPGWVPGAAPARCTLDAVPGVD